jgi:type IV pilus assembly protein PilE
VLPICPAVQIANPDRDSDLQERVAILPSVANIDPFVGGTCAATVGASRLATTHHWGWAMRNSGFTLIELMIAVAILAIVAAVALPLYTQYSQRTYRAEAQADLLNCAQGLERYAAENFSYNGAALADVCDPRSVDQNRYNIGLNIPADDQFTLTATPVAGATMDGDGIVTYDNTGNRGWDRNNDGDATDADEDSWEE